MSVQKSCDRYDERYNRGGARGGGFYERDETPHARGRGGGGREDGKGEHCRMLDGDMGVIAEAANHCRQCGETRCLLDI